MQEKINKFISKTIGIVSHTTTVAQAKIPQVRTFVKNNKKKLYWIIPLLLLIGYFIFKPKTIDPNTITLVPVETKTLTSTVKASGTVTSTVNLELSFKKSDLVDSVDVAVGDKVRKGQILATLKNQSELGLVTQARGALARVMEGASSEEERIAQVLLDNAKTEYTNLEKGQTILVENARRTLYSNGLIAVPDTESTRSTYQNPSVYGTYTGQSTGEYVIEVYPSSGGYSFNVSGLGNGNGLASVNTFVPIGQGLSIQFPADFSPSGNNKWRIKVPNTESPLYTTNKNAYDTAIQNKETTLASARSLITQREAELALKKAPPRNGDVLTAQGQLQNALGSYEGTVIRAPADGIVTKVSIKPGELARALESTIVIQDVSKLYVEANINESTITTVIAGQPVLFTIDAFGSSRTFSGTVTQVDMAPTVKDGIVNYTVKASLDDTDPLIKAGMNANLIITTGTKENVLAIPGATITKKDEVSTVKRITDIKKKKFKDTEVVTGIVGDGNMTEIVSGLVAGDSVALVDTAK